MDGIDWLSEAKVVEQERSTWLTVERAAYAVIGLLAAAVRLWQLGLRPLAETEAAQALAAFRFTQGMGQAVPAGTVPALFTGNAVAFTLFGSSDGLARWLPALAGLALVLLPYWLRHRLGRGGALAASLLLALSPLAVYFSRAVDGAMIVATAALVVVVGLMGWIDTRRPAYLYAAAVALGLGLTAGPGMVSVIVILALYGAWLFVTGRGREQGGGWVVIDDAWQAVRREPGLAMRLGVVLAAVFGLLATTLVLYPAGIGLAADLLGTWVRDFGPEVGGQPWLYPLLVATRYELAVLVLGLGEALHWLVQSRRQGTAPAASALQAGDERLAHTPFLVFWAAAALLLVVVSGHRPAGNVLLAVVPLALLAGQGVEQSWRWIRRRVPVADVALIAAVVLGLAAFGYLQLAAYGLATGGVTVDIGGTPLLVSTGHLLLMLVAVVLLVGVGAAAWYARGSELVAAGGWLALTVLLVAAGVRATWGANFVRPSDPRELIQVRPTASDVRRLAHEVETLSQTRTGDAYALPVVVESDTGPVVAWYLRAFTHQEVVDSLAGAVSGEELQAAVTLAAQDLPLGESFRGQGFPLRTAWQPWDLGAQAFIRWLMFAETLPPAVERQVVLWTEAPAQ